MASSRLLRGIENIKIAAKYYRLAAKAGLARAQFNMGVLHSLGLGVANDQKKSVEFYTLAAEQGLAEAQLNLAVHFYTGKGVEKDMCRAFKLTKNAAKQGMVDAEFRLALMLNDGIGVERNPAKALVWFQNAAAKGHERAGAFLQETSQTEELHNTDTTTKSEIIANEENKETLKKEVFKKDKSFSIIPMAPINSS